MEELELRYKAIIEALETLKKALKSFDEQDVNNESVYETYRDSLIKRFEYSMDTFWKYLREHLEKKQGILFSKLTPNQIFRECLSVGLVDQDKFKILLKMTEDRNNTSHAYNEIMAEIISDRASDYYELMHEIVERTKNLE